MRFCGEWAVGKMRYSARPIYADLISKAGPPMGEDIEGFDRSKRKDFWNDPDRWAGIDDPHKVMLWEMRRPDRIDVDRNQHVA